MSCSCASPARERSSTASSLGKSSAAAPRRAREAFFPDRGDAGPAQAGARDVPGGAGVTKFDPNAAASGSGVFGLPHSPAEARVVLVPVPFEATTSYGGGTSNGPGAILNASRQVELFDVETGKPYEQGIAMLEESPDVRAWDLGARTAAAHVIAAGGTHADPALLGAAATVDAHMEKMNAWVRATVELFLERGKIVGTIGGDHSVSFGAIEAHARRWPGLGILHVDAHADLRRAYEGFTWSHASIMDNVVERIPG